MCGPSSNPVGQVDNEALKGLEREYIWWKTPEEAVELPSRVNRGCGHLRPLYEILTA